MKRIISFLVLSVCLLSVMLAAASAESANTAGIVLNQETLTPPKGKTAKRPSP